MWQGPNGIGKEGSRQRTTRTKLILMAEMPATATTTALTFTSLRTLPSLFNTARIPYDTNLSCRKGVQVMDQALSLRLLRAVLAIPNRSPLSSTTPRQLFHTPSCRQTDGVNAALTGMRVRTPWITALKRSRDTGNQSAAAPTDPPKPDLTPKKMSDTFVKVILPLGQDPWMLDTYANVSGQLRTGALLMDLDAMAGVVAYKHTGEGGEYGDGGGGPDHNQESAEGDL